MIEKDHEKKYKVPSLEDLGKSSKDCGPCLFPGGESEALDRFENLLKKTVSTLLTSYVSDHCLTCGYV